jgi:magnesium-transporting ATPase (P-type)
MYDAKKSLGLSALEAAQQLEKYGLNQLHAPARNTVIQHLVAQFKNPLILILMFACIISAISGDASGSVIIATVVIISMALDFVQSYRAAIAMDQLAFKVTQPTCRSVGFKRAAQRLYGQLGGQRHSGHGGYGRAMYR